MKEEFRSSITFFHLVAMLACYTHFLLSVMLKLIWQILKCILDTDINCVNDIG